MEIFVTSSSLLKIAAVVEEISQDSWADLPEEIVSKTTNLKDLLKYMRTSRRFLRLAQNCILFIGSDELIEVPVKWLLQFRNLRGTGDLVRIPLLAQLPFFVEGNFVLRDIPLILTILDFFQVLNLAQKLPRVNFRFWLSSWIHSSPLGR